MLLRGGGGATSGKSENKTKECKNSVEILYVENIGKKKKIIDRKATYQALSKKLSEISLIIFNDEDDEKTTELKETFRKFIIELNKWQKLEYDEVRDSKILQEVTSFYDKLQKFVFSDIDWKAYKYTDYAGYYSTSRRERCEYYVGKSLIVGAKS